MKLIMDEENKVALYAQIYWYATIIEHILIVTVLNFILCISGKFFV